ATQDGGGGIDPDVARGRGAHHPGKPCLDSPRDGDLHHRGVVERREIADPVYGLREFHIDVVTANAEAIVTGIPAGGTAIAVGDATEGRRAENVVTSAVIDVCLVKNAHYGGLGGRIRRHLGHL